MKTLKKHNGKLSEKELLELDDLLYELQQINNGPIPERQQVKHQKPLPEPKNTKLWEYLLHMVKLTIMLPDNLEAIRKIAKDDPYNTIDDYIKDLPLQLMPFTLKYVWRRWEHRRVCPATGIVDCGYVITTAKFAFVDWKSSRTSVRGAIPLDNEVDANREKTGKVCTKNFN